MKNRPLRFAGLVRVSTEGQKGKGSSLEIQTEHIKEWIKDLGGVIPNNCWYKGQEHSTPGYEREIFDRLLNDAEKNRYDAVFQGQTFIFHYLMQLNCESLKLPLHNFYIVVII